MRKVGTDGFRVSLLPYLARKLSSSVFEWMSICIVNVKACTAIIFLHVYICIRVYIICTSRKKNSKKLCRVGMVLQKAMKQGRNVHGIPPRDACSDVTSYNIKGVWPHWGACLLRFSSLQCWLAG